MSIRTSVALASTTLPLLLALAASALAYDPCHRALQDQEAARQALYNYYENNCTWSYNPAHCRNSGRGYQLENEYIAAKQRARRECN